MAFTATWNPSFEGIPADNENIAPGAGEIRSLKLAIRERLSVDHSWAGDSNDGLHKQITFLISNVDPAPSVIQSGLFAKLVSSWVELFYKDNTGNVQQLTSQGKLVASNITAVNTLGMNVVGAPPFGATLYTRAFVGVGQLFYKDALNREFQLTAAVGSTANRPGAPIASQPYFDTTLGIPIWYNGVNWVNSVGAVV